jgi:hypothetical protein
VNKRIVVAMAFAVLLEASAHAQTADFVELVTTRTPQDVQTITQQSAKGLSTSVVLATGNNLNPEVITTFLKAGADALE